MAPGDQDEIKPVLKRDYIDASGNGGDV